MRRRSSVRPVPELTTLPMVCPKAMTPMAHTGLMKSVMIPARRLMPVSSTCIATVGRPSSRAKNIR